MREEISIVSSVDYLYAKAFFWLTTEDIWVKVNGSDVLRLCRRKIGRSEKRTHFLMVKR